MGIENFLIFRCVNLCDLSCFDSQQWYQSHWLHQLDRENQKSHFRLVHHFRPDLCFLVKFGFLMLFSWNLNEILILECMFINEIDKGMDENRKEEEYQNNFDGLRKPVFVKICPVLLTPARSVS